MLVVLLLLPVVAGAQSIIPNNPSPGNLPGDNGTTIVDLIENIITNILLPIAGLVAVLFIIIGGYQYMTSAGNEEQAEQGKKNLINAIIGLVIIILSYVIVTVVATSLLP